MTLGGGDGQHNLNYTTLPAKPGIQSSVWFGLFSRRILLRTCKNCENKQAGAQVTVDYFHSFKPDLDRFPPLTRSFTYKM